MTKRREMSRSALRLARRMGASDAALRITSTKTHMIRFANNEVTVSKVFLEESAELYVAIRERRAVAHMTGVSMGSLKELVSKAVSMAKSSAPAPLYAPLPKGPFKYDKALLKRSLPRVAPERLVAWVEEAVSAAINNGARRVAGSLIYRESRSSLTTTGGIDASSEKGTVELSVRAFADGDASGQFAAASGSLEGLSPERVGSTAGETARLAVGAVPAEPGVYDAVIGPMTFANLIEEVGDAASAFRVDAGISFLGDKLGEEVSSRRLTLIDDPTIHSSYGAEPFDDEGLPTRRNVIIREGVLSTYLHNSFTAKKFGTTSTANAGIIVPSSFSLVVEGGSSSFQRLISSVDNGVLVTNDWYLRYQNMRTGDFSTIPRDGMFLIRNGGIERPIKDLRLSDNLPGLLRRLEEMTAERYWIKWWEVETPVYAPYALIREVNFTKSTL